MKRNWNARVKKSNFAFLRLVFDDLVWKISQFHVFQFLSAGSESTEWLPLAPQKQEASIFSTALYNFMTNFTDLRQLNLSFLKWNKTFRNYFFPPRTKKDAMLQNRTFCHNRRWPCGVRLRSAPQPEFLLWAPPVSLARRLKVFPLSRRCKPRSHKYD